MTEHAPDDLANAISDLSGLLLTAETPDTTLARITALAVEAIPPADGAGISRLRPGRRIESVAPTTELQEQIDRIQTETGEGPCFEALRDPAAGFFEIDDMEHETRWPEFARRVARLGVASKLAFALRAGGEPLGALNLYALRRDAFSAQDRAAGAIF